MNNPICAACLENWSRPHLALNRTLSDVSLVTQKRKPIDVLAKRLDLKKSRGDWIRTSDLCVPNAAL
jgi:hypothetical protein